MDVLTDVLKTVNLSGGGFGRRNVQSPWGIGVPQTDLAIIHIVVRGDCWLRVDCDENPVHLKTGHLALLPHGHGHTIGDSPTVAQVTPRKDRSCTLADVDAKEASDTTMACGYFSLHDREKHPLLSILPPLVHIKKKEAGQWLSTTVKMIANHSEGPGRDALLDQLGGLLFIQSIRAYMESLSSQNSGWMGALRDPVIGGALKRIHENLAHPWTVVSLAAGCAMSRSAFASLFKTLVGETPKAYVTLWRMHQAAYLLRTEGLTIQELCERVGYQSEATFAKAFKRCIGLPPAAYRRNAAQAPSADPDAVRAGVLGSLMS